MTTDHATALREQARLWGRTLLAATPWEGLAEHVTLIVTAPATGVEAPPRDAALWLVIDAVSARALPAEYRALAADEAIVERHGATATTPAITLTLTTDALLERLLQALTPRALEARWQLRHCEAVADRLRRTEQLALRAGLLPDDAPERILRPLWLAAQASARALEALPGEQPAEALPAAGELAAALCRIACFMDEGAYPPADLLLAAARPTRIGRRLAAWLDGLVPALGGDAVAARRVTGSLGQALAEVQEVIAERFRGRPWLGESETFALRTPR